MEPESRYEHVGMISRSLPSKHFDVLAFSLYISDMNTALKRSTIYLDPQLHRALKIKSAQSSRSISELVNEAIKLSLAEDHEDLEAFEERIKEPNIEFETVLKELKASGKL